MDFRMLLSLVMPTRHRSLQALKCAKRIIEVSEGLDFEIVISAHPEQETVDAFATLKDPRVRVYYAELNNGIEAWNHAASQAQGDYMSVSDDDLWYNPGWWEQLVKVIDPKEIMYVGVGDHWAGPDSEPWAERAFGTRRFFKEILGGVICVPHYKSHHDDVEKSDKARAAGVLSQAGGDIEHRHYARNSSIQRDETNARAEQWYGSDAQTYMMRKAAGFPIDYEGVF